MKRGGFDRGGAPRLRACELCGVEISGELERCAECLGAESAAPLDAIDELEGEQPSEGDELEREERMR